VNTFRTEALLTEKPYDDDPLVVHPLNEKS
jgi:hypothetical protein